MATRTQKEAAKAKAKAEAEAAKSAKATKGKAKKPSAKPAAAKGKGKGSKSRSKSTLEFEEIEPKVGFFERLRQKRAERAVARQEEAQRRAIERAAREQHERELEAKRLELAAEAAAEQAELEAAEQRKAAAAARRAQKKAEKEAEEAEAQRLEAERVQAAADEAARKEAEKLAAAEEQKARRAAERNAKRAEMEAEERRLAAKQAERDSEEEAERRRQAVQEAQRKEAAAEKAKPAELEPEMEFQDAPKPVDPAKAMIATGKPGAAGAADVQADRVAAELAKRRSKPVVIVEDEPPAPRIPGFGSRSKKEEPEAPLTLIEEPVPARPTPAAQESMGMSLPEAFLLLANEGGWDERAEKNKPGFYGAALAGSMLLELLLQRQVQVQRDRFVNLREETGDPAIAAILARVVEIGDRPSLDAASAVAKRNRQLLLPFKDRLAERGLVEHGSRKHLGLFHRSWVNVLDADAQERLRNRLRRAIAGGGTPEAASILLLGLLDAAGLLGSIVPDEAMDYNRKRLNGLLGGRDIMGYKVDPELKALQEIAVRTILQNVRLMTVRG